MRSIGCCVQEVSYSQLLVPKMLCLCHTFDTWLVVVFVLHERERMLYIDITVTPSSGRQEWKLDSAGRLKCFLKSVPEKGKANDELVRFLAKSLGIPQTKAVLTGGSSSRKKRVCLALDITMPEVLKQLGVECV